MANGPTGVPFSVLKTFNRLKQLTTDDEVIADALSLSQGLLEVSADRKCVKRALPLPEDLKTDSQSVYAVGLGMPRGRSVHRQR